MHGSPLVMSGAAAAVPTSYERVFVCLASPFRGPAALTLLFLRCRTRANLLKMHGRATALAHAPREPASQGCLRQLAAGHCRPSTFVFRADARRTLLPLRGIAVLPEPCSSDAGLDSLTPRGASVRRRMPKPGDGRGTP